MALVLRRREIPIDRTVVMQAVLMIASRVNRNGRSGTFDGKAGNDVFAAGLRLIMVRTGVAALMPR